MDCEAGKLGRLWILGICGDKWKGLNLVNPQ
jgi:hypothetical protein